MMSHRWENTDDGFFLRKLRWKQDVNINCQVVYSEGQPIFHIFLNFCNAVKEEIVSIQSVVNITALVPTAEKKAGPQTFLFSLVLKSLLTIKLKTLE